MQSFLAAFYKSSVPTAILLPKEKRILSETGEDSFFISLQLITSFPQPS
jgi:hypothetical protein